MIRTAFHFAKGLSIGLGIAYLTIVGMRYAEPLFAARMVSELDPAKAAYQRPSTIPFPDDNPFSKAKAQLGKVLFFDPRLSRSGAQSCGSCHNPSLAWGDGLPRGVGDQMNELGRRSPSILNTAWAEALMWDGRFETLEEQAFGPIQAAAEMNMDLDKLVTRLAQIQEYKPLFAAAFDGDSEVTADKIAVAIATYERTIVSGVAPFDRWIGGNEGAISDAAKRGFALFNGKANCSACHSGWRFTDDSFHDIGLPGDDIGRGVELPNIPSMQHAFKTPGLRDIDHRAPYMHDGSLATLDQVIELYDGGSTQRPSLSAEIKPLNLTSREKRDLIEFMKTLTAAPSRVDYVQLPR